MHEALAQRFYDRFEPEVGMVLFVNVFCAELKREVFPDGLNATK